METSIKMYDRDQTLEEMQKSPNHVFHSINRLFERSRAKATLRSQRRTRAKSILVLLLLMFIDVCVSLSLASNIASWYGESHRRLPMANTKPFSPDAFTASWFYPFGTRLLVGQAEKSIVVTVTDRGPARRLVKQGRTIDLSQSALGRLAPLKVRLIPVRINRLAESAGKGAQ